MNHRWIFSLFVLILTTFACNWSDIVPPPAPEIEPTPLPTFAIPSATPVPTETPLPTPTSTPAKPIAWPKNLGVNCRYGPGLEWETVSSLPAGTTAEILGRTVNTAWWYIRDPLKTDDSTCWVAYDVVDTAGNLNIIPIVELPVAMVTDVRVDIVVVTFAACEGSNPVTLNGSITANGPVSVTYHWEVSGAAQETTADESLKFTQSGRQNVSTDIPLTNCGEYTAVLRITEPIALFAQKNFNIQNP